MKVRGGARTVCPQEPDSSFCHHRGHHDAASLRIDLRGGNTGWGKIFSPCHLQGRSYHSSRNTPQFYAGVWPAAFYLCPTKTIQVDIEPSELGQYGEVDLGIAGDIKEVLKKKPPLPLGERDHQLFLHLLLFRFWRGDGDVDGVDFS